MVGLGINAKTEAATDEIDWDLEKAEVNGSVFPFLSFEQLRENKGRQMNF